MSSGSYNIQIYGGRVYSTRSWSGDDDPKKKKKWNAYYGRREYSNFHDEVTDTYRDPSHPPEYYVPDESYGTQTEPLPLTMIYNLVDKVDHGSNAARALSHLRDQVMNSDFNAGVALGEGRETIDAIVSLTRGTLGGLRSLRKGNVMGAFRSFTRGLNGAANHPHFSKSGRGIARRRILHDMNRARHVEKRALDTGDVSSLWLAFQYGWQPLMSDIQALGRLLDGHLDAQSASVHSYSRKKVVSDPLVAAKYGPLNFEYLTAYFPPSSAVNTEKYYAVIVRSPRITDRLGLTDPATVIWELVPFSFVVDWFVPIGDWLQNRAMMPFLDTTIWSVSHWEFVCKHSQYVPTGMTLSQLVSAGWAPGGSFWYRTSGTKRIIDFRRSTVDASIPAPSFKRVSEALSLPHLENAAALIHQLFK